ncbi:hypothetical protein D0N36_06775 [Hymenobacter lapidiphilus]|uniref:hypothetical protein n=1 Tax=Hymenobacter sp. CCM 8763 TaxID=2303334 RepID=UPI000E3542CE|nr:hypothetical protein [Hymenobacter sp. CCM 8763]RFP65901.1 hypothetical protein D0N36_06775 [Hymenobacter sp. CCM 8763]
MQTTPSSHLTASAGGAAVNQNWVTMLEINARASAEAEVSTRTYVQSPKQSQEKKYDDRLHIRLGCGKTKAYELLKAYELGQEGGLRHQRIGNKYIVTEQAVQEFFGDAPMQVSTSKAA